MKVIAVVQRRMLAVIFLGSGINGFVRFHSPVFGTPIAREYMAVMQATRCDTTIEAIRLVARLVQRICSDAL
jgi:hypothetical protein